MITASLTLIAQAAPLLIAACAALISEYVGLLNVGIEGLMLLSAFAGISGILLTESLGGLIPGLAIALVLGAGLSMFITALAVYRKANIYILGLSINLTGAGFVSVLSTRLFGNRSIVALPPGQAACYRFSLERLFQTKAQGRGGLPSCLRMQGDAPLSEQSALRCCLCILKTLLRQRRSVWNTLRF